MEERESIDPASIQRLCSLCKAIFDSWDTIVKEEDSLWNNEAMEQALKNPKGPREEPKVVRKHQPSLSALQSSAFRGCFFCKLLLQAYIDEHPGALTGEMSISSESSERYVWLYLIGGHFGGKWAAESRFDEGITLRAKHFVKLIPDLQKRRNAPLKLSNSANDTFRAQILELSRKWLQECLLYHRNCRLPTEFLPTRLIWVRPNNICLYTPPPGSRMVYATLSHCWGNIDLFRLVKNNFYSLYTEIDIDKLCQTFKDAILIVQYLGIEYLWIDSLCIIQDDLEDWLREASTMGNIYQQAIVNIAASSARNGTEGCFQERDATYTAYCRVSTNHPISEYHRMQNDLWPEAGNDGCRFMSAFELHKAFSITNNHGEGMSIKLVSGEDQEQEGSGLDSSANSCVMNPKEPKEELSYDCVPSNFYTHNYVDTPLQRRAWVLQERLLSTRTLSFTKNQLWWDCSEIKASDTFPDGLPRALIPTEEPKKEMGDIGISWETIISQYSRCDLTKPTDKLLAISGVAQNWGRHGPEAYLAGIWNNEKFHTQLCWHVYTMNPGPVPEVWRAPSWSWAKVDSPVMLGESCDWKPDQTYVDLCKNEIELLGDDPYGAVKKGILWLKCDTLLRAVIQRNPLTDEYMNVPGIVAKVHFHWDYVEKELHDRECYLLLVYSAKTSYTGLVLTPTLIEQGQYERIGYFHTEETFPLPEFAVGDVDSRGDTRDFVEDFVGDDGIVVQQVVMLV